MKNKITLFVLIIFGFTGHAQDFIDEITLEATYGMSFPLNYVSSVSNDNFNSFSHFDGGVRYMFDQDWGVKGKLAYDKFSGTDPNLGMKSVLLDAQLYYNFGKLTGLVYSTYETVGMYLHSGFGFGFNKSQYSNYVDHMGSYILGITPIFKISDKVALSTDFSYTLNMKQNMHFDGIPFDKSMPASNNDTSQLGFTVGVIFYLGDAKYHPDWIH